MEQIKILCMDEAVFLDDKKIAELERLLGVKESETVIAKAMEQVAIRLTKCDVLFSNQDWKGLRKTVKSIAAIGEQIGMRSLVTVSQSVMDTIDHQNLPAIAATYFRLTRVGDRTLSDFWDLQQTSG